MQRKFLYFFFSFLLFQSLYSQVIRGEIVNETDLPLSNIIVSLKEVNNPDKIILFKSSDSNGNFEMKITDLSIDDYFLEFKKNGLETAYFYFNTEELKEIYELKIQLNQQIHLEEVTVKATQKIKINKDTVTYNSSAFSDGSEKNLEDLLRKLPGMRVDENGLISFKGKNLDKLLIDGDDLFGNNYTLGSKNIDAKLVDQIQAIENHNDNELLGNLEKGKKTILNLKLSKDLLNFSGNLNAGYGVDDRHLTKLNLLMLNSKFKNMTSVNYNNLSENYSPYNYNNAIKSIDQSRDEMYYTPKILSEYKLYSPLKEYRTHTNDNWFVNLNNNLNFNEKLNARFGLTFLTDQLKYEKKTDYKYLFNQTEIRNITKENVIKTPKTFDFNAHLNWKIDKKSKLEFLSKIINEKIDVASKFNLNNQPETNNAQHSNSLFINQFLLYTKRIDDKHALQVNLHFSRNNLQQDVIYDSLRSYELYSFDSTIVQNTKYIKNNLAFQINYLGLHKENVRYSISVKSDYTNNNFLSYLTDKNHTFIKGFQNDDNFNIFKNSLENTIDYDFKKIKINTILELSHLMVSRNDNKIQKIVFSPEVYLKYIISDRFFLQTTYKFSANPLDDATIFSDYVLTSANTIVKNNPSDQFIKENYLQTGLYYYNLNKQFNFYFNGSYSAKKNVYIEKYNINSDWVVLENLASDKMFKTLDFSVMIEKFLNPLSSTFRFNFNYGTTRYNNIMNDSEIRNNVLDFFRLEWYAKSAFDFPVNFQNNFTVNTTKSYSENSNQYNKNTLINNLSEFFIKPSKSILTKLTIDYYNNTSDHNKDYYFLDFEVKYKNPKSNWEIGILSKNLTNNKNFENLITSDYSIVKSFNNLNRRYVLLNFELRF